MLNIMEDFEYIKRLTAKQLMQFAPVDPKTEQPDKNFLKPFDYEVIFAPKTAKELRAIVGGDAPVGGEEDDDGAGGGDNDDIFGADPDDDDNRKPSAKRDKDKPKPRSGKKKDPDDDDPSGGTDIDDLL